LDSGGARFLHRSRELPHPGVAPADRDPCDKASNGRVELIPGVHAGRMAGVGERPGLRLGRQQLLDAAAEEFGAKAGPGSMTSPPGPGSTCN